MNQKQAIGRLAKIIGKKLAYRINENALVGDERSMAQERARTLIKARDAARAASKARFEELVQDAEYQRLVAARKEAEQACDALTGAIHARRITVGTANELFFSVVAEGDNWAEVVEIVESKHKEVTL